MGVEIDGPPDSRSKVNSAAVGVFGEKIFQDVTGKLMGILQLLAKESKTKQDKTNMADGWISFILGVELEEAVMHQLPKPDPSNEDATWPCVNGMKEALAHPMKAALVAKFGLSFDDFVIFGTGWECPTLVGYPVGKTIHLDSDSQITAFASLKEDVADVERLHSDKLKMLAQALYPGRGDVKPELKMHSFIC